MDTSVFAGKLPENTKLIEFLEELENITFAPTNKKTSKMANKHLKKLRSYSNKTDNLSYIYRWAMLHKDHPFSEEISTYVVEYVKKLGVRAKNAWLRDFYQVQDKKEKMIKQKIDSSRI